MDLSYNQLTMLLPDFGQMTSLKVLSLTSNNLNGSLTQEGSC
uniref:Uncharacterized protein n=1 Tax=Rhizophora mucronata TaxID=61149 RepID=A0A2P2LIS8_RHIMU